MAGAILSDYPDSFGAHKGSGFSVIGPASYSQMTAAPVAGGQVIEAKQAGLNRFDFVMAGLSDSGTYRVETVAPAGHASNNKNAASAKTWVLRWIVVATGAQVAGAFDLSAEVVRLFAVGRY